MRHHDRRDTFDMDQTATAGRLISEEETADGLRSDLGRSCARIRRMKAALGRMADPGRLRRIYANPYIDGEGYVPVLVEIYPDGDVSVSRVERMTDLSWTGDVAPPGPPGEEIAAAHAAASWDPPVGDDDDTAPLTDEVVLAALRSVERDGDD